MRRCTTATTHATDAAQCLLAVDVADGVLYAAGQDTFAQGRDRCRHATGAVNGVLGGICG
jgi:hypothetical protein